MDAEDNGLPYRVAQSDFGHCVHVQMGEQRRSKPFSADSARRSRHIVMSCVLHKGKGQRTGWSEGGRKLTMFKRAVSVREGE